MQTELGHYRLLGELGRGAMGIVYLAEDTRLERRVALKVLPPELSGNPERLERFQREAKAAAAINHPGIVTLHSIESAADEQGEPVHFLTMELVEGRMLGECLPAGGAAVSDLLDWGLQLADALAAAHSQGIVHRDLKPLNLMLTDSGRLKILDFGLARPVAPKASDSDSAAMTADEAALTRDGRLVGTPAYMSPEQAEGSAVDHRTDIFSLGVLLYELACGRRPFGGRSAASVMSAILRDEPASLTELRPELPAGLASVVHRCLRKDPAQRFPSALELRQTLQALQQELSPASGSDAERVAPASTPRSPWPWAIGGTALAVALAVTVLLLRDQPTPTAQPERMTTFGGQELFPNLSSDAKSLVFAAEESGDWDIYLQRIGGSQPIVLTADHDGDDTMPALSPDDSQIAFRSERDGGGLYVMGVMGESPRRIADFGYNPSWSPDGHRVVFATTPIWAISDYLGTSELWVVDVEHGPPEKIPGGEGAYPAWSPNGHRIAYFRIVPETRRRQVFTISPQGGDPVPFDPEAADPTRWSTAWSPDGRHLYFQLDVDGNRALHRQAIDERSGKALGEIHPITSTSGNEHAHPSIAGGLAAYTNITFRSTVAHLRLDTVALVPRERSDVVKKGTSEFFSCDLSPDGSTLLFHTSLPRFLRTIRLDGSEQRDLAKGFVFHARWSPSGDRVAAVWRRTGSFEVYTMRPDGSDLRMLTNDPQSAAGFPVWSPDERRIAYWSDRHRRVFVIDSQLEAAHQAPAEELAGSEELYPTEWSSDGQRLLGKHTTGGVAVLEIATGEQRRLTTSGWSPTWLDDRTVAYVDKQYGEPSGRLLRIDIESGDVDVMPGFEDSQNFNFVSVGPDRSSICYTTMERDADIWSVALD